MDYVSLIRASFGWYPIREFWKWVCGYVALLFIFCAAFFALMPQLPQDALLLLSLPIGAPIFAQFFLFAALMVLAGLLVHIKTFTIALRQNGLHANPITLPSYSMYLFLVLLLLGALCIFFSAAALIALMLMPLLSMPAGTLSLVAGMSVYALALLAIFIYSCIRLSLMGVYFWSRENCGIFECVRLSMQATKGNEAKIAISVLLLALALITASSLIYIAYFALLLVLSLLSMPLASLSAGLMFVPISLIVLLYIITSIANEGLVFGAKPFWSVELYLQLEEMRRQKKKPRKKKQP
ncbi:Uncharacterised protein [Candidatus Anstonella stagnisolia]|nr:Uncharacterised protein [Candidatus Anstonella stagnisolia]